MLIKETMLYLVAFLLTSSSCTKNDNKPAEDPGSFSLKTTVKLFAGSETERDNTDSDDPLQARFDHPTNLALDGTTLWVADGYDNSALRRIDVTTGRVSTAIPWNNFDGATGQRRTINDLEVNPVTHSIMMVTQQGELWQYDPATGKRTLIIDYKDPNGATKDEYSQVQVGSLADASLAEAYGLAISRDGRFIYLSDNVRGIIKQVDLSNTGNEVTVYAGKPYASPHDVTAYDYKDGSKMQATFSSVQDLTMDNSNHLVVVDNGWSSIRRIDGDDVISLTGHNPGPSTSGLNVDGSINKAVLNRPAHVAITDKGIYFNDYAGVRLLRVGKDITTLRPDFSKLHPSGALSASIAATTDGKTVYEAQGNVIYKYTVEE